MKRSSFVAKTKDSDTEKPKDFHGVMKHYHQALNLNNFILDVIDKVESSINEDISWKERVTEDYFTIKITSQRPTKNVEVTIFASDMANHTVPSLAKLIVDAFHKK